jgi:hypothetical protein
LRYQKDKVKEELETKGDATDRKGTDIDNTN